MTNSEQPNRQLSEITAVVRALAEIMQSSSLSKIDVAVGDISIRLTAGGSRKAAVSAKHASEAGDSEPIIELDPVRDFLITAPMIGTYYTSPGPGEPQFVHVGEQVEVGQIIGIIEAMKIMNEIAAEQGGVVTELLATNAQAVEYGSPLIRLALNETDE